MKPVEPVKREADAAQRRYPPTAFVVGVVKKFGDDNGEPGALDPDVAGR